MNGRSLGKEFKVPIPRVSLLAFFSPQCDGSLDVTGARQAVLYRGPHVYYQVVVTSRALCALSIFSRQSSSRAFSPGPRLSFMAFPWPLNKSH
jgi:hypothetical protein